jgi:hypothetical protein
VWRDRAEGAEDFERVFLCSRPIASMARAIAGECWASAKAWTGAIGGRNGGKWREGP